MKRLTFVDLQVGEFFYLDAWTELGLLAEPDCITKKVSDETCYDGFCVGECDLDYPVVRVNPE